jgi:hypothetical protein
MIASLLGRGGSLTWLFPIVYLTVTHSTTALMIAVGLFGSPALAADIALAHGATLATFHALSANTRSLILGRSRAVSLADLVRIRIALVLPLAAAALLLALAGTTAAWWIAVCLVLRRCAEWLNDLQLCQAELEHKTRFALRFLAVQTVLFLGAAVALIADWPYAPAVLAAWALVPLGFTLSLREELVRERAVSFGYALRNLFTHVGSTAVSGIAIFAFRLIVVLMLDKPVAGGLFTAIAIGSFIGTLFANVVGPSVELHAHRTGGALPRSVKLGLAVILVLGLALSIGGVAMPADARVLGQSAFFWLACGLSLIGGVVMVRAQQIRLRLLRTDDGRDVFGPEVLIHVALLIATLFVLRFLGPTGAAALYLINAALVYLFYTISETGHRRTATHARPDLDRLRFLIVFLIVFPLFFQLSGRVYNDFEVLSDSGGVLSTLPLPFSLLACFAGIAALADYRRATRGFTFIFLFFAALIVSAVVTTPHAQTFDPGKLLILVQVLLPPFGLALGEMFERDTDRDRLIIARAMFWACATIMPLQIASTWLEGKTTLTHGLGIFSVYQHLQYVPVVLACAAVIAAHTLTKSPGYRIFTFPILIMSVMYAISAKALLPLLIAAVGLVAFGWRYLPGLGMRRAAAIAITGLLAIGAQSYLISGDFRFVAKIRPAGAIADANKVPCTAEIVQYTSPYLASESTGCLYRRADAPGLEDLIQLYTRPTAKGDVLIVEGIIRSGRVFVGVAETNGRLAAEHYTKEVGPFTVAFHPGDGMYSVLIRSQAPDGIPVDVTITRIQWRTEGNGAATGRSRVLPQTVVRVLPLNLVERIGDWILFGVPVFNSVEAFLVGHAHPMDRAVRSSPHNYYIDLAYNFGMIAVLPILTLIAYTVRLVWRERRRLSQDRDLLCLTAVVLFLVLVDSNLKVTLRQPYPGIFAFFLWGLLIARLRRAA